MKKLTQNSLLLMAMMVAFAGCDAAKEAGSNMANKAGEMAGKAGDMANMDFGDFNMESMKEKLTEVTTGLSNVTEENADEVAAKVNELNEDVGEVDTASLPAPAKTMVSGMMTKFADKIQTAMDGIDDANILSKLKPAVEPLLEKLKSM